MLAIKKNRHIFCPSFVALESLMAKAARPLSPHLQIYRWYLTMAFSIAHRVSGVALVFGLLLMSWWLLALASGPEAFAEVEWWKDSFLGVLALFGLTFVLTYHLGNGVRHLVWDLGYGFDPEIARMSGLVVVAFAGLATLLIWLAIALVG
jgi:succinate dehydrogenase / fumarate reductase cytochrome b subunit